MQLEKYSNTIRRQEKSPSNLQLGMKMNTRGVAILALFNFTLRVTLHSLKMIVVMTALIGDLTLLEGKSRGLSATFFVL